MAKRSDFKRRKNDFYETPEDAVIPLLPHLPRDDEGKFDFVYAEPCAGKLALALALDKFTDSGAIASIFTDIDPGDDGVEQMDALDLCVPNNTQLIITNPPWTRQILHPMIEHFRKQRPTWLLFDADWAHTKQAIPYLRYCSDIVPVGRVKWIKDSPHMGKDNSAWYCFQKEECFTVFHQPLSKTEIKDFQYGA